MQLPLLGIRHHNTQSAVYSKDVSELAHNARSHRCFLPARRGISHPALPTIFLNQAALHKNARRAACDPKPSARSTPEYLEKLAYTSKQSLFGAEDYSRALIIAASQARTQCPEAGSYTQVQPFRNTTYPGPVGIERRCRFHDFGIYEASRRRLHCWS